MVSTLHELEVSKTRPFRRGLEAGAPDAPASPPGPRLVPFPSLSVPALLGAPAAPHLRGGRQQYPRSRAVRLTHCGGHGLDTWQGKRSGAKARARLGPPFAILSVSPQEYNSYQVPLTCGLSES